MHWLKSSAAATATESFGANRPQGLFFLFDLFLLLSVVVWPFLTRKVVVLSVVGGCLFLFLLCLVGFFACC